MRLRRPIAKPVAKPVAKPMAKLRARLTGTDRGSMAVEFVLAGPMLVVLLLRGSAGGQWSNLPGAVRAAARDSGRAASFARTVDEANTDARDAAQADLNGVCAGNLPKATVKLYANGVQLNGPDAFADAQVVEVTVTCTASFSIFHTVYYPVSHAFTDTAAAPLDPFEDRG